MSVDLILSVPRPETVPRRCEVNTYRGTDSGELLIASEKQPLPLRKPC